MVDNPSCRPIGENALRGRSGVLVNRGPLGLARGRLFDSARTSLREVPAPLRMTGLRRGITNGAWSILTLAKMKKSALLFLILVFLILVASSQALIAQSVTGLLSGNQAKTPPSAQTDSLGRGTPSGTVLGFLEAAQSGDYRAAADYLQMSAARRQSQGAALASKVK